MNVTVDPESVKSVDEEVGVAEPEAEPIGEDAVMGDPEPLEPETVVEAPGVGLVINGDYTAGVFGYKARIVECATLRARTSPLEDDAGNILGLFDREKELEVIDHDDDWAIVNMAIYLKRSFLERI